MQTVLVAGGAGFIGSHLCESLLNNYSVICIDNFVTGSKKNIEHLLSNPQFSFIEHDLTKPIDSLNSQLSTLNFIFHLASPASPNKKSKNSFVNIPIETMLVNSLGTYSLLELAKRNSARF